MSKQLSTSTQVKLSRLLENTGDMALKRRAGRIVQELDPQIGDKILEVGCGDGFYLHLLSGLGMKLDLTGVDVDKPALESAKRNLEGKKIKLIEADLMKKLPFKNNHFNKVIMSEVAEHLPNDVKGLVEVSRVLKRGGILVVTVPNHNYPFLWDPVNWTLEHLLAIHVKSGFWAGLWNQHLRLYKPNEIRSVILEAGFSVEKQESLTWWCLPFSHYVLNYAAIKLHSGNISNKLKSSINKFESKKRRSLLVSTGFALFKAVDSLNDIWQPKDSGVGVFLVAYKR